ncbi:MAG: SpoIIE family protein phosphatase [Lachnospiraceae bacterium]|nr:SpoIIE family protein phosphatase [Lachnospiraceae bacterium]
MARKKKRTRRKKRIGQKLNQLLLAMVSAAVVISGTVSVYSLYSMKHIATENGTELGQTAAEDAEKALENLAVENLRSIAVEKAAYIEEKFAAVEAYVLGIADQAQAIYENPEEFPDRRVAPPVRDSNLLAAQLLWSERLDEEGREGSAATPPLTEEILKLGNLQDMLVQYNAHNDMVSSTYVATESGWMIQADYIAYSKYNMTGADADPAQPIFYEAAGRQWYMRAKESEAGQIIYTDVIKDIHEGGDCIVCASPIYHDGEVVAVAGVGSYLDTVNNAVLNVDIGEAGYAFLVNEKGQVLVSGSAEGETAAYAEQAVDLRASGNRALADAVIGMVEGRSDSLELSLDGKDVYLAYAPLNSLGWSFVTVIDVAEVVAPAKASQQLILSLTSDMAGRQDTAIRRVIVFFVAILVVIILLGCIFGTLFSKKLTEPIRTLTKEVAKLDGGNMDYRICLSTGDEIEDLGHAFNGMAEQIQSYVQNLASITAEKERIRTEIQVASHLQADMLPEAVGAFDDRDEFDLAASMTPAKGVGGDFYDFFLLDENRLALVMADVSGKGVPAALFMVVSRTLIRSRLMTVGKEGEDLAYMAEEINRSLCDNNKNGMFVTAWIGVLDVTTGEVAYVNAGHCRPLLRRKNGSCEYDDMLGGLVLAGMEDAAYRQGNLRLRQGDTLLLYTDGVTEATSLQQQLYGEDRLIRTIADADSVTPEELLQALWKDVDEFQKDAAQFDDITMLAVTYHGNGFEEKSDKPDMDKMKDFADFVEQVLEENGISMKTVMKIQMTVDEIYSNICYYSGAEEVTVGIRVEESSDQKDRRYKESRVKKEITLYFEDDGMPYNPLERPDPDVEKLLEQRKEGGLGIYLVKKRMDRVEYEYINERNKLTVYKTNEE